ncbi:MAG: hypothetical protein LBP83_03995, partial [Dysgonamonadaceae bacterium]|nr:hypothetical protein [Dysgonamonadaceae bacterium]
MKHSAFIFFLFALFTGLDLGAQTVSWETSPSSPSLSSPVIGILSEDVQLDLRFSITVPPDLLPAEQAKTRSIRLELPAGVTAVGAVQGTQGSQGSSIQTGTITQTGTAATIPVTSITYNQMVHLVVTLRASDCNTSPGTGNVAVSISNGATLPGSSQSLSLSVVRPDITATPVSAASPTLSDTTQSYTYNIPLSVSNGVSVKSMRITLTKNQFTLLSSFKLGNKNITPTASNATTVVLDLTEATVGATPISAANPQTLQFVARSRLRGSYPITA